MEEILRNVFFFSNVFSKQRRAEIIQKYKIKTPFCFKRKPIVKVRSVSLQVYFLPVYRLFKTVFKRDKHTIHNYVENNNTECFVIVEIIYWY